MAFETRDPIPKGIYWLDVPKGTAREWSAWVRQFGGGFYDAGNGPEFIEGRVKVIRTEGNWKLFRVLAPVPRWDKDVAGFPSVAPRGAATTKGDTGKRPAPKSVKEHWGDETSSPFPDLKNASAALFALALIWALKK